MQLSAHRIRQLLIATQLHFMCVMRKSVLVALKSHLHLFHISSFLPFCYNSISYTMGVWFVAGKAERPLPLVFYIAIVWSANKRNFHITSDFSPQRPENARNSCMIKKNAFQRSRAWYYTSLSACTCACATTREGNQSAVWLAGLRGAIMNGASSLCKNCEKFPFFSNPIRFLMCL